MGLENMIFDIFLGGRLMNNGKRMAALLAVVCIGLTGCAGSARDFVKSSRTDSLSDFENIPEEMTEYVFSPEANDEGAESAGSQAEIMEASYLAAGDEGVYKMTYDGAEYTIDAKAKTVVDADGNESEFKFDENPEAVLAGIIMPVDLKDCAVSSVDGNVISTGCMFGTGNMFMAAASTPGSVLFKDGYTCIVTPDEACDVGLTLILPLDDSFHPNFGIVAYECEELAAKVTKGGFLLETKKPARIRLVETDGAGTMYNSYYHPSGDSVFVNVLHETVRVYDDTDGDGEHETQLEPMAE